MNKVNVHHLLLQLFRAFIKHVCNSPATTFTVSAHHTSLTGHHLPLKCPMTMLGICWVPPCLLGNPQSPTRHVVSADVLPFHHQCLPYNAASPVLSAITRYSQTYRPSRYLKTVLPLLLSLFYLVFLGKIRNMEHALLSKHWKKQCLSLALFTKSLCKTTLLFFLSST